MKESQYTYKIGFKDGLPIGLGYLFVSIGFGITAVNFGIPVIASIIISMTNLTSAGQVAGIEILSAVTVLSASAVEMILTQIVINLRYSLMGISLSQKLDRTFTTTGRLITSFFITDEIFALASSKEGLISTKYMLGLSTLPFIGWTLGTTIGALAASWMPREVSNILGIAIYGMFMSIVIPTARENKGVMLCAVISAALSCLLRYIPAFSFISSGFSIIICSVISAVAAAILKPVKDEGDNDD